MFSRKSIEGKTSFNFIKAMAIYAMIAVMGMTLIGCTAASKSEKTPGTIIEETATELVIIDQANREVTVTKYPKSYGYAYRVIARFLLNLDQGNKIVGAGKPDPFLESIEPSLKNVPEIGRGVIDTEALAKANPELVFHRADDIKALEAIEKLGIKAVGLTFETTEEMITAMEIMGAVCGEKQRARELVEYYRGHIEEGKQLTEAIKSKKTALVMGSKIGKVADGNMLQGKMIEDAGGTNVAQKIDGTETWPTVGVEQIFKWDPEYIFITGNEASLYTPEKLYQDATWSNLKAVKSKNIFVIPAPLDSWEFPGIVSVIGMDYMISKMYPEKMAEEKLEKNIEEFYKLAYRREISKGELGQWY